MANARASLRDIIAAGETGQLFRVLFDKGTPPRKEVSRMKKKRKSETGRTLITLSKLLRAFASLLKAVAELIRLFS